MATKTRLRYFDASALKPAAPKAKTASHSEFLRTGRISRQREDWLPTEKRYLTYEEVAERTEKKLVAAGEKTHERINAVHRSIQFPKIVFSRSLDERPHLGYCHVTASSTHFGHLPISWSFYMCNFLSEIGEAEQFFERIRNDYGRMYFAVAIEGEPETRGVRVNRAVRGNGILFKTTDPQEALKNVLLLGAHSDMLREIIKRM